MAVDVRQLLSAIGAVDRGDIAWLFRVSTRRSPSVWAGGQIVRYLCSCPRRGRAGWERFAEAARRRCRTSSSRNRTSSFRRCIRGSGRRSFAAFVLGPHLRKSYGVHSIETRGAERLKASLDAGHGVILAPNHCRMSDPLTFGELTRVHRPRHARDGVVAPVQAEPAERFMLRRIGAFSVYREGVDRQAIDTAVDILVDGERPLVLFAEGAISRHNDQLMPMMDGVSFIARTAAKRREKSRQPAGVVIHPVAIRYFYRGNLEAAVMPVLEEIEGHFSWFPQNGQAAHRSGCGRSRQALLSLKEIEYFGWARTGDFYERVDKLIEDVLDQARETLERAAPTSDGVVARVKNSAGAILPGLLAKDSSPEERLRTPASNSPRATTCSRCRTTRGTTCGSRRRTFPSTFWKRSSGSRRISPTACASTARCTPSCRWARRSRSAASRDRGARGRPRDGAIRTQLSAMLKKLSDESPRI